MTDINDPFALEVFAFIRDYIDEHGMPPTLREIGAGCHSSHTTILTPLTRLETRGWIMREYRVPRSIRLGEYAPDAATFAQIVAQARNPQSD